MNQIQKIVSALCTDVGTPRALAVKLLVQAGEWAQLQKLRVDPSNYVTASSYFKDALVTELLRKTQMPSNSSITKKAALENFILTEKGCRLTNDRLDRFLHHGCYNPGDERVADFIVRWRKTIQSIIGRVPCDLTPRFSGGATVTDTGMLTTIPDKMSSRPSITESARFILPLWEETAWARALWSDRPWCAVPVTSRGNIFFSVPKNSETERGCAKEPAINIAYQLDVGRVIRTRLKREGIDIKVNKEIHVARAQKASRRGDSHVTIDLSKASDTISRKLIQLVLPPDWYDLLNSLRSGFTLVDGSSGAKWYRLEKFSSMGNGFTFELETLLFYSLAKTVAASVCPAAMYEIYVHGDDIIVDRGIAKPLIAAMRFFGFEVNREKTFLDGPFRESCGGDFFDGTPVRAHYLKELPDEPQTFIALANGIRRVAYAHGGSEFFHRYCHRAWAACLSVLPDDIRRLRGPAFLGDIVIHDESSEWAFITPSDLPKRQRQQCQWWEGAYISALQVIAPTVPWDHWTPAVQLGSCTLGVDSVGVLARLTPDKKPSYRIGRVWINHPLPPTSVQLAIDASLDRIPVVNFRSTPIQALRS